jgi:hypothetical protein
MSNAKSEAKDDWLCKGCLDHSKKSYVNKGFRDKCNICKVPKKQCSKGKAPAAPQRVPASLATRQLIGSWKLEADLVKAKKEAAEWKKIAKGRPQEVDAAMPDAAVVEVFEFTVAELQEQKAMLLKVWKRPEDHPDVVVLVAQIAVQQEAKTAVLPGHVQMRMAEQRVKKAKAGLAAQDAKSAKLKEELEALQKSVLAQEEAKSKADKELVEAEQSLSLTLKQLQAAPEVLVAENTEQRSTSLALLPDEAFEELGHTRQEVSAMYAKVAAVELKHKNKQREKVQLELEAAEKTKREAEAAAAAQRLASSVADAATDAARACHAWDGMADELMAEVGDGDESAMDDKATIAWALTVQKRFREQKRSRLAAPY